MDNTAHVKDHGLMQLCQSVAHTKRIFMKMSLHDCSIHTIGVDDDFHTDTLISGVDDEEGVQGDSATAARSSLEPTAGRGES